MFKKISSYLSYPYSTPIHTNATRSNLNKKISFAPTFIFELCYFSIILWSNVSLLCSKHVASEGPTRLHRILCGCFYLIKILNNKIDQICAKIQGKIIIKIQFTLQRK